MVDSKDKWVDINSLGLKICKFSKSSSIFESISCKLFIFKPHLSDQNGTEEPAISSPFIKVLFFVYSLIIKGKFWFKSSWIAIPWLSVLVKVIPNVERFAYLISSLFL